MTSNGKRGWYKATIKKIDMGDWGREDLYVGLVDPNSLPYGEALALQEHYKQFQGIDTTGEQDPETVDKVLEIVISLIREWNMTDPDTDEPMPKPTSPAEFRNLPMDVLTKIFTGVSGGEDAKEDAKEDAAPLENEIKPDLQLVDLAMAQPGTEKSL